MLSDAKKQLKDLRTSWIDSLSCLSPAVERATDKARRPSPRNGRRVSERRATVFQTSFRRI